jgi:hypothetical protein
MRRAEGAGAEGGYPAVDLNVKSRGSKGRAWMSRLRLGVSLDLVGW